MILLLLLRMLGKIFIVLLAALTGNWLGGRVYALLAGGPGYRLGVTQPCPDGEMIVAINPLMSNLLPGVLAGLVGRPRWLFAFLGGFLAATLLGDRYEEQFWALFKRPESE